MGGDGDGDGAVGFKEIWFGKLGAEKIAEGGIYLLGC